MYTLFVAFSREAADYAEEHGFKKIATKKKLRKGYDWDEKIFNTQNELNAYAEGLEDGNGWDQPYWQQKKD